MTTRKACCRLLLRQLSVAPARICTNKKTKEQQHVRMRVITGHAPCPDKNTPAALFASAPRSPLHASAPTQQMARNMLGSVESGCVLCTAKNIQLFCLRQLPVARCVCSHHRSHTDTFVGMWVVHVHQNNKKSQNIMLVISGWGSQYVHNSSLACAQPRAQRASYS
jgi:hypothetical protein